MRLRRVSSRFAVCRLTAGMAALLGILTSFDECADGSTILDECDPNNKVTVMVPRNSGKTVNADFCVERDQLWMKGNESLSAMASLCCGGSPEAITSFRAGSISDVVHSNKWYPIGKELLTSNIEASFAKSGEEVSTGGESGGEDDDGRKNGDRKTRMKQGTNGETKVSKEPDFSPLFWIAAVAIIVQFGAVFFLALWMLSISKDVKKHLAGAQTRFRPSAGLRPPEGAAPASNIAELGMTGEALAQVLRQALQQKIRVELAPPDPAAWEPLLLRLGEVMASTVAGSVTAAKIGGGGRQTEVSPAFPPALGPSTMTGAVPRGNSARKHYVQRDTTYGVGAKSFGGELVFGETNNAWAGFYVESDGRGTGMLYPNPSAREFDPLYERLFSFGANQFPFSGTVKPQPVKWNGNQWVIDSQAW